MGMTAQIKPEPDKPREETVESLVKAVYGKNNAVTNIINTAKTDPDSNLLTPGELSDKAGISLTNPDSLATLTLTYIKYATAQLIKTAQFSSILNEPSTPHGHPPQKPPAQPPESPSRLEPRTQRGLPTQTLNFDETVFRWMKKLYGENSFIMQIYADECTPETDAPTIADVINKHDYPSLMMYAPTCAGHWLIQHADYVFNQIGWETYLTQNSRSA